MCVLQHMMWQSLFFAAPASAAIGLNQFYFGGDGGRDDNSSYIRCGTTASYSCPPPSMCGWDDLMGKWYCCRPGKNDVCHNGAPRCDGGDKHTPSANQQICNSGVNAFCCDKLREECTRAVNQINICWSKSKNILEPLNATKLNETYNSLTSAFPSQASYTIDRAALFQFTSTFDSSTTSLTAVASDPSSTVIPPTQHETAADHDRLSGGAIGGIIGGVIGGFAFIIVAAFMLWRRRRGSDKDDSQLLLHNLDQATGYKQERDQAQPSTTLYSPLAAAR